MKTQSILRGILPHSSATETLSTFCFVHVCSSHVYVRTMAHEIQDKELSDEEYDENADEDFNPETGQDEASSSEDEEQAAAASKPAKGSRKRKAKDNDDDLDSGDEATIQERKKKRKKATTTEEDEDSGGEGGLIKTRAQRLAEKIERKNRKKGVQGEVTVDVEALWADLQNATVGRESYVPPKTVDGAERDEDKQNAEERDAGDRDEVITIKRRIEYAGQITEVEERVPRSSKEAQRYLREHPEADPSHPAHDHEPEADAVSINRPLRRASLFEPNPSAIIKGVAPEKLRPRAPNRLDVLMAEKRQEEERKKRAEKMSTVQKSALDWRGWVDKQDGLREELNVYRRSKQGFLAREDFLGRAEYAREVQAREARLKG